MANLEIKQFFMYSRFPENEVKIILALIYLPIGLFLLLLRCVLALFLVFFGQVLPDSRVTQNFLNNLACICFGITVSIENVKMKENLSVYISNYLSVFDHLAISKALGFVLPLNKTPLQSLPGFGLINLGSVNNTETFKRNLEIITKNKKLPVLFCPEETPTNGKALLKFNTKYFEFFEKVQPLCVTIKRPFLDISISTIGSTYINDVLYFMYSPFTIYNIKFLPSLEKKSLSSEEFAEIIRENIATELKVEASTFSASDIVEWSKRHLADERRRAQERTNVQSSSFSSSNPELTRMATQVKEVLPHVPVGAIYSDLAVTRSIDVTITNILEGRVRFIPEPLRPTLAHMSILSQPSTSSSLPKSTGTVGSSSSPFQLNTAASSFGTSASERTKSFKERKEQLIAAARRRYIEKHNLDIPL